jgi:hypothetical protein
LALNPTSALPLAAVLMFCIQGENGTENTNFAGQNIQKLPGKFDKETQTFSLKTVQNFL